MKLILHPDSLKKEDCETPSDNTLDRKLGECTVYNVHITKNERNPVEVRISYKQRLDGNKALIQEAQRLYEEIRLLQEDSSFSSRGLRSKKVPSEIIRIWKFRKHHKEE